LKKFLVVFIVSLCTVCSAQITDKAQIASDTMASDTVPFHYPYLGPRIPPWMGITIGYEGYQTNCWEAGLIFHLPDYNDQSGHKRGVIVGGAFTYKQSFSNRLKTIELEGGAYAPVSIGFGFNENFYGGSRIFGFRPFLGTSWFHLQILAGYNFYSKRTVDIADLDHFTIKVRYAIPVRRLYKEVTTNPGNNY